MGGEAHGEHAGRYVRAKRLRRKHVRRRHEQPSELHHIRRELLGRLLRLRSEPRRRRGRPAPSRAPLLARRRAECAGTHSHARAVRRSHRRRGACHSRAHARDARRRPPRHAPIPMIEIKGLTKNFGRQHVLQGVDLTIAPGRVTAVVGHNGAGKMTLIKAILGLSRPDGGTITIDGAPVNGDPAYRARIGYMPQIARFPENLSAGELLDMIKDLRDNSVAHVDEELISRLELADELRKPLRVLSGGTRQKVNAVIAFLFSPDLLILDEPTAGLDPVSSSTLKDKILAARAAGRTVVITSHVMSELEELADDLAFLIDGRVQFAGPLQRLKIETRQLNLERAIAHLMRRGAGKGEVEGEGEAA